MTKTEAIEKAKAAIERAEGARGEERYSELNIADRWITLAIQAFPAGDREPLDA